MISQIQRIVLICKVKSLLIMLLIFLLSYSVLSGQRTREDTPPLSERIFYGGSFSLQIGSITNIEVAPVIGLWVFPRLAVAAGPDYRFYKDWDGKTHIFGGRSYVQFVIFRDLDKFIPMGTRVSLFLHCEDEMLSLESEYWNNVTYNPKRFMINTVLAGGGISEQIGARSSVNIMVLWTFNDPGYPIYSSPVLRIGFAF
jgi:hypothetical protein